MPFANNHILYIKQSAFEYIDFVKITINGLLWKKFISSITTLEWPFLPCINYVLSRRNKNTFNHSATWHTDREFKHGRELNQHCLNSEKNILQRSNGSRKTQPEGTPFTLLNRWPFSELQGGAKRAPFITRGAGSDHQKTNADVSPHDQTEEQLN